MHVLSECKAGVAHSVQLLPMADRYYLDASLMFARALDLDPSIKQEVDSCRSVWVIFLCDGSKPGALVQDVA